MSDDPPGRTCSWKPVTDAVKAILSDAPEQPERPLQNQYQFTEQVIEIESSVDSRLLVLTACSRMVMKVRLPFAFAAPVEPTSGAMQTDTTGGIESERC